MKVENTRNSEQTSRYCSNEGHEKISTSMHANKGENYANVQTDLSLGTCQGYNWKTMEPNNFPHLTVPEISTQSCGNVASRDRSSVGGMHVMLTLSM